MSYKKCEIDYRKDTLYKLELAHPKTVYFASNFDILVDSIKLSYSKVKGKVQFYRQSDTVVEVVHTGIKEPIGTIENISIPDDWIFLDRVDHL